MHKLISLVKLYFRCNIIAIDKLIILQYVLLFSHFLDNYNNKYNNNHNKCNKL